jgi:hypothetical protein
MFFCLYLSLLQIFLGFFLLTLLFFLSPVSLYFVNIFSYFLIPFSNSSPSVTPPPHPGEREGGTGKYFSLII